MKILKGIRAFWQKFFPPPPPPRPLTEEERMRLERLQCIHVYGDGGATITDLPRYLRNSPELTKFAQDYVKRQKKQKGEEGCAP